MDEYNLHKRVKKDVEFLTKELESMHAALIKVGEVPHDQLDRQVKLWADEVRELSYNMEDVVDKFLIRVEGIQQPHDNTSRFKELKNKMIGLFKKGKNHHRIADAVKEIKEQLQEVAARRDRNKVVVPNPTEPIAIDPCLRALYAEATELVGIYGKRDQELMRLLSVEGDDASKKRLKKVSIVGFGGLGKTTLARAVYEKIKGDFDCRAFVPVGQNPDMQKVLRDILIDLGNPPSDLAILDANQLIKRLHDFLENKTDPYLVIIDDIWDEKLWEGINFAFSNRNNLGSRLITTTRNFDVSKSCCLLADDSIYKMKPLSTDDSRRLFHKRIFSDATGCPSEFQQVSEDILKKCGGVPLAIITIASALASGQQVKPKHEWDIMLQSLGCGLTKDNSLVEMRRILSFSYYNLPSHLKTCLLYLCIYPEDSTIHRDRLIWKWVAEGFVHHGDLETSLFLVGLNYFNQLINRSMIQPIYDNLGQVHFCRVHDMVLDLICNLSQEAKFVNVLDGTRDSMSFQGNVRRLSLQDRTKDHQGTPLRNLTGISRVRSITIFTSAINIMPALSRFEVLRVLDLSDCNLGKSSSLQLNLKGVGHLIHLRYLGLAGTGIRELSAEIGNLQFLEVLDLGRNYKLDELPSTLFKLRRLINLNFDLNKVVPPPGMLQNLTSIEVLRGIGVSLNIIAQELGNLARLRELQICFEGGSLDLYEGFVKSLCNLRQIEILCINRNSEETSYELMDILGERWVPPAHLHKFEYWMPSQLSALRGWIKRDPSHLSNVTELFLKSVKEVQQEDMEIIGGLLSLRHLYIRSTHQTQRLLVIRADGFHCMVVFHLDCGSAAQIIFEPGSLPRAEEVWFSLGVRVAKEDGNCGFDLGLQGNLLSLRRGVLVYLYCGGARVGEAKAAEAAVRHALEAHPNHPSIYIRMVPDIAEGAHDDDLCEES
uniref:NBS-LRR disease resistance protein n=1 Tax=Dasypyrum villosum TaxID=40247 RepID=A0A8K1MHZ0_9POAL|nr:NBS-LRR disease resistance protein [Dasypyrum villosum]